MLFSAVVRVEYFLVSDNEKICFEHSVSVFVAQSASHVL